jgi:gamma-glutamylcyclotransferase (GGCT)/AIG2-like uncharacterized protein YtfP
MNKRVELRTTWTVANDLPVVAKKIVDGRFNTFRTPDVPQLQTRRGHLLFVYGNMKAGFPKHKFLTDAHAKFVAMGVTTMRYSLFFDPGSQQEKKPVMMPAILGSPAGSVLGQLWMVYPDTIFNLDMLERNGDLFQRMKVQVQIINKPEDREYQLYSCPYAWAYMGRTPEWKGLIDTGVMEAIPKMYTAKHNPDQEEFINWKFAYTERIESNQGVTHVD